MKLSDKSKRLGVFIFYDKDYIIDDYEIYMLNSLKEAVDDIIFVSNSKIKKDELKKLSNITKNVELRENKGLDAGAFKHIYDKYGADYFKKYDELILLNDTFYGPFKPFKQIINEMNDKDLDFWGLTANYESDDGTSKAVDGFIHSHIQTYFIAFRKTVLESEFFQKYWANYKIEKMDSFIDVVNKHESYFTYRLENEGFKWDTYINLSHYKSDKRENNYNIYGYSAYTLLKYYNFPIIKRKNFVFPKDAAMYINSGIDTKMALDYIKDYTDYDVNLIYKNLLRLYHPIDLYHGLNLNYVVDEDAKKTKNKNCIYININDDKVCDILRYYISNIKNSDVIITTEADIELDGIIKVPDAYKYVYSKRNELEKKYDYFCIINIEKQRQDIQERIDSDIIRIFENSIKNDGYINGVNKIFDENQNIEALFMPCSFHNRHFKKLTRYEWRNIFYSIDIKNIGNKITLDYSKFIVKNYKSVWFRTSLLDSMPNVNLNLKQYIAILHEFVNKDNMLVGKIYNKDYMSNDILCYEVAFRYMINTDKIVLSFPDRLLVFNQKATIFRRAFRRIVPFSVRKKIKSIRK